ncbi:MAG: EAL domain-containing protein [Myxococcales bacterium FL481]|nr:MAG: EAL domain-containing protein [Myxococcales bacterium FL481]
MPNAGGPRLQLVGATTEVFDRLVALLGASDLATVQVERVELSVVGPGVPVVLALDDVGASAPWQQLSDALERVGSTPLLVLVGAHPERERPQLRRRILALGASECLFTREMTGPLLECVLHQLRQKTVLAREVEDLRERFDLAVHGSNDGIWEWELRSDLAWFSARWLALLGYGPDELGASIDEWFHRVHPRDLSHLRSDLEAHLRGEKPAHEHEHRVRDKAGRYRWVLSRGVVQLDAAGEPRRIAGSLTDISHYRRREQNLRRQSQHDALTELPRRELFLQHLARALELSAEHNDYCFTVLLVELDRFGMIHNSVGHRAADAVLARLARRLEACVRPDDLVARFGTQQFGILLENLDDSTEATKIAGRIHQSIREPFEVGDQTIYSTVSIGMTSSRRAYEHVEDIVTDVITAVGRAKERGHDRHEVFDTQMRIDATALLRLEMALRQAVEQREFVLYYQPIVSLPERKLTGFEALIRWRHPRRGIVPPSEFISVAENTGLIVPIGRWALTEAIEQLRNWRVEFDLDTDLSISVNLSSKQTTDPNLAAEIAQSLQSTQLQPGTLKLELTESVLMANPDKGRRLLNELRALGLCVYIDDFGTGYSSLSYLHRLPVDGFKIDKSFVDALDGSPQSETIVRTIMNLAQNLSVDVVAEGIEREAQAEQLRALGCPLAQGFFFSRPLSAAEAYAVLARGLDRLEAPTP